MSTSIELSRSDRIMLTCLGAFAGIILGQANQVCLSAWLQQPPVELPAPLPALVSCACGGLIAGALQGRLVRRSVRSRALWLALSSLGWVVLSGLQLVAPLLGVQSWTSPDIGCWILLALGKGAAMGLLQSLAVRPPYRHVPSWVAYAAVSWALWSVLQAVLWML